MSSQPNSWGSQSPYYPPTIGMQTGALVAPAYNPVQVRRSFEQLNMTPQPIAMQTPPQAQSSPETPGSATRAKFPKSCREYVAKAYLPQAAVPGIEREDIDRKLKETIRLATEQDRLWSTDWDTVDTPQVMIQKERRAAVWTQDIPFTEAPPLAASFNAGAVPDMKSKKRKSMDNADEDEENALNSALPWRTTKNGNAFEERVSQPMQQRLQRFGGDQKASSKFQKNMEKRQRKLDGGYKSTYKSPSPEASAGPVVGRCQTVEKKYFRLTAAPNPDVVRPQHILEKALDMLKTKWKKEGNYNYICDQFKAIRQDLTVQRIKNEFTVSVYEIHARIALEKGDLGEYNQCQTQLKALYAQNIPGKDVEFKAYRILYFIHTCNRTALNDALADLTTAEKREKAIKHALDVRSALALGNYHRFFRLYLDVPNMGAYLMDMFVHRERLSALSIICRSYRPQVRLRVITEELGFEGDGEAYQFIMDFSSDLIEERIIDGEEVMMVITTKAGAVFETAKTEAFRKVDLKGQI